MDLNGKTQSSGLLRLPPEILMHISSQADPVDRIPMALSCKKLLAISQIKRVDAPDPIAHRAPWSANPAWRFTDLDSLNPECRCGGLEVLLRQIRPRNTKGHVDRTLQLCVDCLKYLPRRKSYWISKRQDLETDAWDSEVEGDWDHAAQYFSTGIKMQCPKCRLQEHGNIIGGDMDANSDAEEENGDASISQLLSMSH